MSNYPKNLDIGDSLFATSTSNLPSPNNRVIPIKQLPLSVPQITAVEEPLLEDSTPVEPQYLLGKKVIVRNYILKK